MTGLYDGHLAVELYKRDWILRARLDGDRPLHECPNAVKAMAEWMQRNKAKAQ